MLGVTLATGFIWLTGNLCQINRIPSIGAAPAALSGSHGPQFVEAMRSLGFSRASVRSAACRANSYVAFVKAEGPGEPSGP